MSSGSPCPCPECGATGEVVPSITLESLLRPEAKERLEVVAYFFCSSPRCSLVYYPEDDSSSFTEPDLTVPVGLKVGPDPRPLCYCFGHTLDELRREIAATGSSRVPRAIASRMQDGCWCETTNPRGRCCLGTIHAILQGEVGTRCDLTSSSPRPPTEGPSCCARTESEPPR